MHALKIAEKTGSRRIVLVDRRLTRPAGSRPVEVQSTLGVRVAGRHRDRRSLEYPYELRSAPDCSWKSMRS